MTLVRAAGQNRGKHIILSLPAQPQEEARPEGKTPLDIQSSLQTGFRDRDLGEESISCQPYSLTSLTPAASCARL